MIGRGIRSGGPHVAPSDKYLPAWVILAMTASVLLLTCQTTATVKDVCLAKGGCPNAQAPATRAAASATVAPNPPPTANTAASPASSR